MQARRGAGEQGRGFAVAASEVRSLAQRSATAAAGIDQVNNAVTQMDDTTQQNAALVEEAASASKAMEQQAQSLVTQISFFKVRNAQAITAPAPKVTQRSAQVRTLTPRNAARTRLAVVAKAASQPARVRTSSASDDSWQEF